MPGRSVRGIGLCICSVGVRPLVEPGADVSPVQVPKQEDGEDGVESGEECDPRGADPEETQIFEASQVVDAADQDEPSGPAAAQPVEDDGDALQSDERGERDVNCDDDVRRNLPECVSMGRSSGGYQDVCYIYTDCQSHKQGCERYSDGSPHGLITV